MNDFLKDVIDQPYDIEKAVEYYYNEEFRDKLERIVNINFSKVIFTGMGSSHFGSIGASLFLNENKINSFVMSSGQLLHYGLNMVDEDTLLIMISQSGESAEILGLLDRVGNNAKIVGITNNSGSILSKKAMVSLVLNVPDEESVTTRTYLATIIVTYILARYLTLEDYIPIKDEIIRCTDSLHHFIEEYKDRMDNITEFFKDVKFISCIGRGASWGSALAGGLFLKEVSKFPSEGIDSAEFRHGPIEIVDDRFGAIVFAPEGKTGDLSLRIACDISSKGGKVMLITDKNVCAIKNDMLILKYKPVDECLSPVVEIIGVQFLCNILAEKYGYIPGKFRWSHKVMREE